MFQSLLCWIMVCKSVAHIDDVLLLVVFQSLLCWIMVCKSICPAWGSGGWWVSILVMLDYGL